MTLAVGGVPSAQLSAISSTPPIRPPSPPPQHNPRKKFLVPTVLQHPNTCPSMEASPASPLSTHLSVSLETFLNSSPSPPPLLPSYPITELPAADLPPPPSLAKWQKMAFPRYMCCYDPPSPEVKSEYDPQLPPGFFSTPDFFPSTPPPPVPPPPRPSPPPPPTPPTRRTFGASSFPYNAATFSDEVDLLPELAVESGGCEDNAFETCSTSSLVSSSTLTATYFQTPVSDSSPLPPQALRLSPLSTDAVTSSSWVSNDSMTPSSDISTIPSSFSASQEYALDSNTSEFVQQASMLADEPSDAPVSPDSPISSLLSTLKLKQRESPTQVTGAYKRNESFKSECDSSVPSEVSCTTIDTAGPAVMSSPLSTDVPSLSSFPTDPDLTSSGFGSLTTDTWSLSTEVDSQSGDISLMKTKPSGSTVSETAYSTVESGATSPAITASCIIVPMETDCPTPHSPSPASTPVPSPNTSSPLPYFEAIHLSHKLLSPSCSVSIMPQGTASLESLQTANRGVASTLLLKQPTPKTTSLEHSRSYGHSSTHSPQSHYSPALDIHTSQPPPLQATKQVTTQTNGPSVPASSNRDTRLAQESSSSKEIFFNMQSGLDNNPASLKASYGTKTGSYEALHITLSTSNETFSDKISETQISVVIGVEEDEKVVSIDGSERREASKEVEKDSSVQVVCKEEEDREGRVTDVMECSENVDNQVVKDVNGNISYLGSRDACEAQLENGERVRGSESEVPKGTETQTMKPFLADIIQLTEGILEKEVKSHRNISQETLRPLSSSVPPPSLAYSHILHSVATSLSDIPSDDTLHLHVSPHPQLSLTDRNKNDSVFSCSGTSSSCTHCNSVSPKSGPHRAVRVSSTPKDAMELLDTVVVGLESLSAGLPASPTPKAPEPSPSQSAPGTVPGRADQLLTHDPETCETFLIGDSQDRNTEEPKVAACHLPLSPSLYASPPHPTSLSPTLPSHPSLFTPTLLPYVGLTATCGEPSRSVSSLCPLPTTNMVDPARSVSSSIWDMPHPDLEPFLLSHSPCDHIKTTLLAKGITESSSEEEVIFCSHQTDFQDSLPVVCGTPPPSLHSSPQPSSLLDGQPSPSPAPCSRTPPTPPPRSCHNTPRTSLAAPLPPPRQYMLVPINQPLGAPWRPTPPPAPPRSTSVRKSSPPPRPAAPHLPPLIKEWNEGPPLPPPPPSSFHTTPPQTVLTPVPEESSTPQSPVLSKTPHLSSPVGDGASPIVINPPNPFGIYQQSPSQTPASPSYCYEDPPALPPPPKDEQDEEDLPPPPPPPPPAESEDEAALPLPLPPPPPPDVLLGPLSPLSPPQSKSKPSTPLCLPKEPALPDLCVSNSITDLISVPSSDPDPQPRAVDDLVIPPPSKLPSVTTSPKSAMPNSQAVDAAPPPPPFPAAPHASPSSLPQPSCAPPPGPNAREAAKSSLITTSPYGKMVVVRSDLPLPTPEEEVRIAFTASKDWGFLAEGEDTLSVYTQLRPVIQQGPQCGLVALSMASQVFPQTVEVEELLAAGRAQDLTRHGEMFSATVLAGLAEKAVPGLQAEVRRDVLSSPTTLLQLLLQGDLVLVPYDAERNHQPGLKGGHKAHWGVVCGCLVQSHALAFPTAATKLDSHVDQLWHLRPRSRAGRSRSVTPCTPTLPASSKLGQRGLKTPDGAGSSVSCSRVNTPMFSDLQHDDELKVVALWRQGKSRKVVAAPLEQLCESNDQLMSYPRASTPQEAEYVVGSVQDGLAGQVVVLHKTKVALSDLVGLLQEK